MAGPQSKIQLYGCFKADQRTSMGIYAEYLLDALNQCGVNAGLFYPKHGLEHSRFSTMAMRYLRYVQYPRMVGQVSGSADLHHVIDHGYAHLHSKLPNKLKVVTVHDLIPYLTWKGMIPSSVGGQRLERGHGRGGAKPRRPSLNLHSLSYLKRYDRIIAVSQSTSNDLQQYLDIAESQIHVVPPIISNKFYRRRESEIQRLREKLLIGKSTKVILITGREHYKNLLTSVNVVKNLVSQGHDVRLIRSGLSSPVFDQYVVQNGLTESVTSVYLSSHDELPALYSAVDCLLFPSWYEGFGMPVAEALACGTPVVCSDRGSLSEIGGDLTLVAAPDDVDQLSDLVWYSMTDDAHRQQVRQFGPSRVLPYGARQVANRLIDAYGV